MINAVKKDLSSIPNILKPATEGLTVNQIFNRYQQTTVPANQVQKPYLRQVINYAIKNDIIIQNGYEINPTGRDSKRMCLKNVDIPDGDWNALIELFRESILKTQKENRQIRQAKKAKAKVRKLKGRSASRPAVGKLSETINDHFDEARENPNKQYVESFFIGTVAHYLNNEKVSCLTLTGPDYNRHITKLFNSFAEEVFIVENMNGVFEEIMSKAKTCPYYMKNQVKLLNCNLEDVFVKGCKYIDLDFMVGMKKVLTIIKNYVEMQTYTIGTDSIKFITFTTSNRNDGGDIERLVVLKQLMKECFNATISGFHGGEGLGDQIPLQGTHADTLKYCHKRIPIIIERGTIVDMQVITYSDSNHPMLSILVLYK